MVAAQPPEIEEATRVEIARERRPKPAGEVQEREIGGKKFKLGKYLSQEVHNKITRG